VKEGLGSKIAPIKGRKIVPPGLAGLAGQHGNRYIGGNLWFSYDRVLRVGPSGPALFYYPNEVGAKSIAGHGSDNPAGSS
jgi:hypothetical protein